MRIVLIAGGSGSGKTTVALLLAEKHPDWTVIHLDNYQRPTEEVPRLGRWRNWDHPDAIDFDALLGHLQALRRGESVDVKVRSQTKQTNVFKFEPVTLAPGPVILLEGYLALWHPEVRAMAEQGFYLDAPQALRLDRRRWKKSPEYVANVLEPMFREHLEPTKAFADVILDTSEDSAARIAAILDFILAPGQ